MTQLGPRHVEHAPLGGSSARFWAQCSGYAFFAQNSPPIEETPDMQRGSTGHLISEQILAAFLQRKVDGVELHVSTSTFDPELVNYAERYKELVWDKILNQSLTGKEYGIEDRVSIADELGMYGFVDFWATYTTERANRRLAIADLKCGSRRPAVDKNPQLAFYAVAGREEARRGGKDVDEVLAAIIHPASDEPFDYRETLFTGKQLDIWKKRFMRQAHDIFVKQKPVFKVGDWCEDCRFKGRCEAYGQKLAQKSQLAVINPSQIRLTPPQELSDEMILKWVKHYAEINAYGKSVLKHAHRRFFTDRPLQGTKCVEGGSKRKWIDRPVEEIADYLSEQGVSKPVEPELIGIPAVERELIRIHGKKKAKELLSVVAIKPPGKVTLVLDDDPRPAVQTGVDLLEDFTDED